MPNRSTADSRSAGIPVNDEGPVEEAGDGDLVGRDQRRRRTRADPAGLTSDPQGREPCLVGRAEVEAGGGEQVGRRRR